MAALHSCGKKARVAACAFVIIAAEFEINAHLSIFGRIDNLADEHYSEVFGFPALGRPAYGGMKVRF
jgi:vitamin B12 transporter